MFLRDQEDTLSCQTRSADNLTLVSVWCVFCYQPGENRWEWVRYAQIILSLQPWKDHRHTIFADFVASELLQKEVLETC